MSDGSITATESEIPLTDCIVASYARSKISTDREQKYLPEGSVERLITPSSIREELSDIPIEPELLDNLISFIVTRAKKVFTITILSQLSGLDLYNAIKTFQDVGFDDDKLPVLPDRHADLMSAAFKGRRLWNAVRKEAFLTDQWGLLVPVFTKPQLMHSLQESAILPLERVSSAFKGGTFGDVYEATVHPAHMDDELFKRNGSRNNIAVKEIKASQLLQGDVQKAYDIEALALARSSKVEHENLIPCLAAIEKGSMHYFLFPWADAGSLEDFWQSSPKLNMDFLMDVFEQLRGLAAALEKLHSYDDKKAAVESDGRPASPSGGIRHGDLKPANILIFKSDDPRRIGTMKIADMGLAKYHQVQTRLRRNATSSRYGTSRYEPPEAGVSKPNTTPAMSRLYDTWSMGCIFLQFLIWLLQGKEALRSFNESIHEYNIKNQWGSMYDLEPPYYIIGSDNKAQLHPLAVQRFGELSRSCTRNTAIGDLLHIVKTKLLIVDLPSSRERPTSRWVSLSESRPRYRATAQVLRERLDLIVGNAKKDPYYLFADRNRENAPPPSLPYVIPRTDETVLTSNANSRTQRMLINTWIKECDENHPKCRGLPQKDGPGSRKAFQLPTRLIDIGQPGSKIQLYETRPDDKTENLKYIALSHQWGDPTASNHFRTTTQNYAAHLNNIDFYKLPDTFKDAVTMTRDMGIRYLWIDSICIIQGPDGDFNTESQRMEDVFSSAYCVIAASCARDQWDGFLKNRPESDLRRFATFRNGRDPPFYVCQFLDDFNTDVLEGPLNKRGWVLQERVLARRTIFFTDKQIYWECGNGVRCETLTHMKNELAAFLGDPNFPEIAIHSPRADRDTSHGEKILYYQDLYKTYSRLAFSKPEDRCVAMNGLEQRLSRGFVCNGKFGILDDKSLFHRSLLWRRAVTVNSMEKISFPADRQQVPSWSWMAVKGEMDYIPVPFDTVDWETNLKSPLRHTLTFKDEQSRTMEIRAKANELAPGHGDDLEEFYDRVSDHEGTPRRVLCVVVGRSKSSDRTEEKFHYVLLVSPKPSSGPWVCERVGAGKVPGSWIDFTRPAADIGIC
ncbi:hypothetical protein Neosp_012894 [[Neocosmospora] mangrovei]